MSTYQHAPQPASPVSNHLDISDESLVFHVDVVIIIVILVLAIFKTPRSIARLRNRSEWFQGLLLRYRPLNHKPRIDLNTESMYLQSDPSNLPVDLDNSTISYHTTAKALPPLPSQVLKKVSAAPHPGAEHIPVFSSVAHRVENVLTRRVHEGYTIKHVLLIVGYMAIVAYSGFYKSNPFSDPMRAGWVATSQIPFVYIFATKNNVIGMLLGVGYEKLNYFHRHIGRLILTAANVHALGYIYKWSLAGTMSTELARPFVRWGFVALVCVDLLGICSIRFIRAKSYNLFVMTHALGLFIFLFAACYHRPGCVPYVITACVFYGLDHLIRIIKSRVTTATLRPIPELGLTRVEIPTINAGWHSGQHVRLRVLSSSMGFWGLTEVHPFTVANATNTEEGLVLLCQKSGKWTKKMYELSSTAKFGEKGQETGKLVRVMIEGPYGGIGNTVISNYSGALFVVGGSGITFALSAVQDLVRLGSTGDMKIIDLVWSIRDIASLIPMIPFFTSLVQRSSPCVRVSVFYTRAATGLFQGLYLPPGITLEPGRPKIPKLLDDVVTSAWHVGGVTGVFIGVCGPASLAEDVAGVVRTFDSYKKQAVGGIELHEE
ncbi:ferric reductase like transmembrane component-domain-containing protein [Scleroderma yunnanense]